MRSNKPYVLVAFVLVALGGMVGWLCPTPASAAPALKLPPRSLATSSSPAAASGAVWLFGSNAPGDSRMYTVPAGKTLCITDVVVNRNFFFEIPKVDDQVPAALTRTVPGKSENAMLLNFWVRGCENVVINLHTPIELNAGDILGFKLSTSAAGNNLICRISGYLK